MRIRTLRLLQWRLGLRHTAGGLAKVTLRGLWVFGLCLCLCLSLQLPTAVGAQARVPESSEAAAQHTQRRTAVVVSHEGLRWLAEKLLDTAGALEFVSFVPPGATPETFEPAPSALAKLSKAEFFIASGVPYERAWLPRIRSIAPGLLIIEAFSKETVVTAHGTSGVHHDHHGHDHDPHLWSSPARLRLAADEIVRQVSKQAGHQTETLRDRLARVNAELLALEREIASILHNSESDKKLPQRDRPKKPPFFVFHPAWGAFAEDFGLEQIALEDQGRSPGPAYMQKFAARMRASGAKVIFVQPQMSRREADSLARHSGARVEVVDPLARDLPAELRRFAQILRLDFQSRTALPTRKP